MEYLSVGGRYVDRYIITIISIKMWRGRGRRWIQNYILVCCRRAKSRTTGVQRWQRANINKHCTRKLVLCRDRITDETFTTDGMLIVGYWAYCSNHYLALFLIFSNIYQIIRLNLIILNKLTLVNVSTCRMTWAAIKIYSLKI